MLHFRVGELDGVSLEMDKWKSVYESKGHSVIYIAGTLGSTSGVKIPEMALDYPLNLKLRRSSYAGLDGFSSSKELEEAIEQLAKKIEKQLLSAIKENKIDLLVPNNVFSLPLNIPTTLAIYRVLKETGISCIAHHHDFIWERTDYSPQFQFIKDYLTKYYPPVDLEGFKHVVINSLAQNKLKELKGVESTVVPNVFYFKSPDWQIDDYNNDLRSKLNIDDNDILILQATRIVKRKGIELVIDVINELQQPKHLKYLHENKLFDGRVFGEQNKFVMVFPNLVEDDIYKEKLEEKLQKSNVEFRFSNDLFLHQRTTIPEKKYALWDSYPSADIVSYPSLQEGWGNQFLEAVKAKLPIIIFEYDVYDADIGPKGFQTISLGGTLQKYSSKGLAEVSSAIIESAAQQTIQALTDNEFREKMVSKNFEIGVDQFSLKALGNYILPLLPTEKEKL